MTTLHIFVNAFWNRNSGMSGGDKRVIEILRKWDGNNQEGFSVKLYAPLEFLDIVRDEGIEDVELINTSISNAQNKGIMTNYIGRTINALRLIPKKQEKQIFYSSSDYFPDVIPCMIGQVRNKKSQWIALVHHVIEHYSKRPGNKLKNLMAYAMQQLSLVHIRHHSSKILLVSPLVYEYMKKKKVPDTKLQIINNGVDISYIEALEKYSTEDKKYDALMLARLAQSKGVFDLPIIWRKVIDEMPNAKLAIIGGGSEEIVSKIQNQCVDLEIEKNVDLLGFVNTEDAYRYLKSGKIFIFTSREEGWGISLAEAMACELPVVAFDLPVYKYIFKEHICRIKDRNIDKMANEIVRLLKNEEEREKKGQQSFLFVKENYDWSQIAEQEKKIICDVISNDR